jgi:NitT/TauT family transport system substrate-binding protein
MGSNRRALGPTAALLGTLAISHVAFGNEPLQKVVVGMVPTQPGAATYIAIDKGYFRDAGLEVEIQTLDSASNAMALLASNRMQVVEGGFAAGYWNALGKDLPVTMAMERASTPLHHSIMISPAMQGKIKTIADLKGRSLAEPGPGSIPFYEAGKVLESVGLTIKSVDTKIIPFPQMGVALSNHAVDAAISVPPFSDVALAAGLGINLVDPEDVIRPLPMTVIAYMANTEWAKQSKDVARRYFVAIARGAREYCQAYHHGPNRAYVIDLLIKNKVADRALLENAPWPARDPNGRFNVKSVIDVQDWFLKEGMITQKFPAERLIDTSYAEEAAKELGPFELVNKASTLPGCR